MIVPFLVIINDIFIDIRNFLIIWNFVGQNFDKTLETLIPEQN